MMSSEESEVDDEGDHEAYNVVIPLPWRATIVDEFLYSLDEQFSSERSAQAKRQTKLRFRGTVESMRSIPPNIPSWAIV